MRYDVRDVLANLKKDPMAIIYTENFLEEIERRDIPESRVEHLLQFVWPAGIESFPGGESMFRLHYPFDESHNLVVIVNVFNLGQLIVLSAFCMLRDVFRTDLSGGEIHLRSFYDEVLDLMTLSTVGNFSYSHSVVFDGGILIDFDRCGYPVSVEIFRFSKTFKLNDKVLPTAKIEVEIVIDEDLIKIRISAAVRLDKVVVRSIEKEVLNVWGLPVREFQFKINP